MTEQKKVVVRWDAAVLRAEPEEMKVNSRAESVRWELESSRRGARITRIVFAGDPAGPFTKVAKVEGSSDRSWQGDGSKNQPLGQRYKYSVFVADSSGEVELDPYIIDTDKP